MARLNKNYFKTLKGKTLNFKEVNIGEDIRVEFTDKFPDFKVKMSKTRGKEKEIRFKVVKNFADVKLNVVDRFEDFSIFIK